MTERTELAGAPLLGGNSDIGFEFGAVGTLTRFGEGHVPYLFNMDLVLAASVNSGPAGAEIAQQNYLLQVDLPNLIPERLRVKLTASFQRTVDQGYFGFGNGSSSVVPDAVMGSPGLYFQFDQREAVLRSWNRVAWQPPYQWMFSTNFRYVDPVTYRGSRLERDASMERDFYGLRELVPLALGVGVGYDTRDNEFFPSRGAFHHVGMKFSYALPARGSVRYGEAGSVLAWYVPVTGKLVFAARGVADAQFGHVPFYDQYTGGVFQTFAMPGGPEGIRGVPLGRYLGLIKLLANVELRALLVEFHLLGATFHFGGNVFADAGRVWRDYHFRNTGDGSGVGVKWGSGAGLYLQWGQAAVFRAEFAYSPDAADLNPHFPLGVYVAEGVMF